MGGRCYPAGEFLRTFTVATTTAIKDLAQLQNLMPVILEPAAWPVWLGEEAGDHAALLRPAPAGTVLLWPVDRAVNSVRNNGPDLLDQVDDPHAPSPSDASPGAIRHERGRCMICPKLHAKVLKAGLPACKRMRKACGLETSEQ